MSDKEKVNPQWAKLLEEAVTKPGVLLQAYRAFYNYSAGNQMAAFCECKQREIPVGPIATYNRWQALGRNVKRGEKAITLCMPVTVTDKEAQKKNPDAPEVKKNIFVWKSRWFVLSQTEGKELGPDAFKLPNWDKDLALKTLNIREVPFENTNGNIQGYAMRPMFSDSRGQLAINPLAQEPLKTLFHEVAHILLGHTDHILGGEGHGLNLPRNMKEVEAESVALILSESLNVNETGPEYCRGYIQDWYKSKEAIPEQNAMRIFKVADQIMKAGIDKKEVSGD